jgi:hypothetical protein
MNDTFNSQAIHIQEFFPKLSLVDPDRSIISGEIDLVDSFGEYLDTYSIEIRSSPLFPSRFPYLYETGERIPKNFDWHVFEGTGICCIKVPAEEILECQKDLTLIGFIENQVLPYLFNQTFRRIHGYFLNERRHGIPGFIDFYSDVLKTLDVDHLIYLLNFAIHAQEPNRVSVCFCGSHLKYRHCHKTAFRLLKSIDAEQLVNDLHGIYRYQVRVNSLG